MKSNEEIMNILRVYDQTLSYQETARQCGCSPHTVARYVKKRQAGTLGDSIERPRPSIIDPYREKIAELVAASSGRVRAKAVHKRLKNMGYKGSDRTTRTAVAAAKMAYAKQHRRIFRPWVTEPGHWAQFDWANGPVIDGREDLSLLRLAFLVQVPGGAPGPRSQTAEPDRGPYRGHGHLRRDAGPLAN